MSEKIDTVVLLADRAISGMVEVCQLVGAVGPDEEEIVMQLLGNYAHAKNCPECQEKLATGSISSLASRLHGLKVAFAATKSLRALNTTVSTTRH